MDPPTRRPRARRLEQWIVPAIILFLAAAIIVVITGNWNTWASERVSQKTDDAYVRADLTPLSTKVAGLVGTVPISDYQPVKARDLLVQLRGDDHASGRTPHARAGQESPRQPGRTGNAARRRLSDGVSVGAGSLESRLKSRLAAKIRCPQFCNAVV